MTNYDDFVENNDEKAAEELAQAIKDMCKHCSYLELIVDLYSRYCKLLEEKCENLTEELDGLRDRCLS